MAFTLPGNKIFEFVTTATVAGSPFVSPFVDTTGYTTLFPVFVFTNSTGTTTLTCEGSFDGATLDSAITYAALVNGTNFSVQHPYVRFRIVQATADATSTRVFVQSRQ